MMNLTNNLLKVKKSILIAIKYVNDALLGFYLCQYL